MSAAAQRLHVIGRRELDLLVGETRLPPNLDVEEEVDESDIPPELEQVDGDDDTFVLRTLQDFSLYFEGEGRHAGCTVRRRRTMTLGGFSKGTPACTAQASLMRGWPSLRWSAASVEGTVDETSLALPSLRF